MAKVVDTILGWGIQNARAGKVKVKPGMNIVFASVYLNEDEKKELSALVPTDADLLAMLEFWIRNEFNVRITPKNDKGFEGVTITHTSLTYKGKSVAIQGEGKTWHKAFVACFYKMACIKDDRGLLLTENTDTGDYDLR